MRTVLIQSRITPNKVGISQDGEYLFTYVSCCGSELVRDEFNDSLATCMCGSVRLNPKAWVLVLDMVRVSPSVWDRWIESMTGFEEGSVKISVDFK